MGAGATAIATGVKTNNGILSQSASAIKNQKDGDILKTFFEYAREHGLSTGAVSNDHRQGVTNALTAAFFAHNNNRGKSGEIFEEMLAPKSGLPGLDVAISPGRSEGLRAGKSYGPGSTRQYEGAWLRLCRFDDGAREDRSEQDEDHPVDR
ncbi:MAG: phoA 2 [Edaphobacter sp.]|nr:phoA 2 [Edaphobacter sp.]